MFGRIFFDRCRLLHRRLQGGDDCIFLFPRCDFSVARGDRGCVGFMGRRAIITRYLVAANLEAGGAFLFCGRELFAIFPFLPLPFG